MRHLDDLLYRQWTAGALVDDDVRAHLAAPCDLCAQYLEARTIADRVDGRVDAALLPLGRSMAAVPGELEAILGRVSQQPTRWSWRPLAVAAVALIAVGVGIRRPGHEGARWNGLKGEAPLTLATSLAIADAAGRVRPGASGAAVAPSDVLSLRLDLSREARVSVVRVGPSSSEILLRNEAMPAGQRDLRQGGQLVGIPLTGLSGEQQVRVVASERLLTAEEIEAAARGSAVRDTTVGGLSVKVAP